MNKRPTKLYVKRLLEKSEPGVPIDEVDQIELRALIACHPDKDTKIGSGIHSFFVRSTSGVSKCFNILRTDGTEIDFSYHRCYGSADADQTRRVLGAARKIVAPDIYAYRDEVVLESGKFLCAESGEEITREDSDVDHYPVPFADIFSEWKKLNGLSDESITLTTVGIGCKFTDAALARDFRTFHKEKAKYRILKKEINVKNGAYRSCAIERSHWWTDMGGKTVCQLCGGPYTAPLSHAVFE